MTFDPATIAAYVDGELDLVTARRIEAAMVDDAELAQAVERERDLRARLSTHYDAVLDEPVPDALAALLRGVSGDNVDTSFSDRLAQREEKRRIPAMAQWGAMAASLALAFVAGGYALRGPDGISAGGDMVASGELSRALDTQLASNQTANAPVRIGTSFASQGGSYCRTFESASLDGIACREGGEWQLRQTMSGSGSGSGATAYRQASSGALAEAAAAMMAGAPLDAEAEKVARDKGWKR